jgi:hypothetical protein
MDFCDTSLEFDLFESMRRRLARALVADGRDEIDAERIALYVMQGVYEVPALLNALASDSMPDGETRALLDAVLNNAASLERARMLLAPEGDVRADES